ncbi:protein downstream neighbor of son homolog isoform X2 [Bolinopsis microptera]|uniref:protein downstream neighbor of son homolog isoform X2 n=1 Tax=Bolinopsis microptera TaxID=2820187 RepID=UPI00307A5AAB
MMSNNKCLKPPMMMKLKRKKFGASQRTQCDPYVKEKKEKKTVKKNYCHGDEICKRQLMNPFQSVRKTQNLLDIKDNTGSTQPDNIFNMVLNKTPSSQGSSESSYILPELTSNSQPEIGLLPSKSTFSVPPRDWSVKLEYKLQSSKPFKWCSLALLKPSEEACCTKLLAAHQSPEGCSDRERLRYYLSYWVHPNIPWLKLFPRDRPSVSKSENTVFKQEALTGLLNDWCASFESLFGLLKAGHCPYFYVCSHQTTVLFRSRAEGLCADLVPTTYGVRNSLKQEDIEFTMPLAQEVLNAQTLEQENLDTNGETGDARDFLDSLGIDSKRYSELDPSTVKMRAAGRLKLDHSIRSLVRVQGSQVQGVFNFLLNNKSLIPTVGELAGVPPTLLSPSVFVGGTIKHNQVKCGSSHARQDDGTMDVVNYLHLTGPILPSNVEGINKLLRTTQKDFSGKFESLLNSTAYNSSDPEQPPTVSCNLDSLSSNPDNLTSSNIAELLVPFDIGHSGVVNDCSGLKRDSKSAEETATIQEINLKDGVFSIK